MFAKSDARDGPTRSIAVNQRMFVRNSGPTTANANPSQIAQPKWYPWWVDLSDAGDRDRHPAEREHDAR